MEVALMHLFAAEFETDGESALSTYGKTVGKWPRVFVVSILQISVFIPIILFAAGGMKNTILCLPMLVGIILIGYLSIRLTLMIPEIVVGDAGLADAVKDSWRKTGGNFWVIFAINLFSGLLSALLVTLPLTVVGTVISNGAADPAVSKALGNIFDDLANILILPFSICIQLVIYYQLTFDDQHRRDLPVTDPIASEGLENEAGGENPPSRNRRKSSARKAPPGRGSRPGVKRNRGE
jgi:hypothetical protein